MPTNRSESGIIFHCPLLEYHRDFGVDVSFIFLVSKAKSLYCLSFNIVGPLLVRPHPKG